jgi:imidazolonepropionase-like amidohydrolase
VRLTAAFASALLVASPALAETTAIVGATVALGDGSAPIPDGVVLIEEGRIVAAGAHVAPPKDARIVDAHGRWVTPGLVSGFSVIGLFEVDGATESNDYGKDSSPYSAGLDVAPALNGASAAVHLERAGGVTRAFVSAQASRTIFGGEGALMTLAEGANPVSHAHAFELVELGQTGARLAGGSRVGAFAALKDALRQAEGYRQNPKSAVESAHEAALAHVDLEALLEVLDGKVPLLAHAERASDIRAALAVKKAHPGVRLVLLGAAEGWMLAGKIAAAHVPVIAAALTDVAESFEQLGATESNVGLLEKAGVKVAISTIDMTEPIQERRLPQLAGNLVGIAKLPNMTGLTWGEALATITSRPAEALGLGADFGALLPGRHADVVIWDGDPLEVSSAALEVFIDGVQQPMQTRQKELLQRYFDLGPQALPRSYQNPSAAPTR